MALANMKAELKREGITQREVAEELHMTENNLSLKLNEKIAMTVEEAKFINSRYLPHVKLDYLLQSDGDIPRKDELIEERDKLVAWQKKCASGLHEPIRSVATEVIGESVDALDEEIARREA